MKFKSGTRRRALEYEKEWVQTWKDKKTFEKSVENRPKDNSYVFYDGPPFISGIPHHGTLLSSIVKDAVPRYQTMKGKRVERVWGWDCHGLPAERYTEKKLGLSSREEVIDYGIEKYIVACRNNMVQTSSEWENVVDRIGRWVDFKGAYKTMDKEYMESVWWAFKTLYDKGKIYEGEKVLMYCTLDATPLSKAEVTMDAGAYQDVTDPSVYVKFKLEQTEQNINKLREITREIVGGGIVSSDGKILLGYNRKGGVFEDLVVVPGGGVDEGEAQLEALRREMLEEVGIDIDGSSIEKANLVMSGSSEKTLRETDERVFVNMEFHNYTVKLDKKAEDIELKNEDDFERAQWFTKEELLELNFSPTTARFLRSIGFLPTDFINEADEAPTYLLAWTTTPWTLPANTAIAVHNDLDYVEVEQGGERLILAKSLVEKVLTDEKHQPLNYKVVRKLKGSELVGQSYEPLFVDRGEKAHQIWHADYVSAEDGSGIVHLAPTYGEEDFQLAREKGFPAVHTIDENGLFTEGDWEGKNVWEINKQIAKDLKERGVVWKIDYIKHSYPHCHRCGTKLMYRAHPSWFMDIDGQREKMLEKNAPINWFPGHVKHGRFEKTVQQAPDWNISRDRFWATAMPVWKSESGKVKVVGSYAELKELSGVELEDYHRPWIDDVTFEIDGETYTRTDKVMDSWFEAGSMPFAQFHYPFENKEKFEANFPGDFIVEYIGQVRAWFYYMHAMSVALFGENSFKNVIVTGNVAGNDGRKMSKSYGNYTDPNELMDKFSADSLRYLLLSSPLLNGEDFALQDKEVGDVARKLSMIWNMYDFFTMYAEVDNFTFPYDTSSSDAFLVRGTSGTAHSDTPDSSSRTGTEKSYVIEVDVDKLTNPLDIWIISRLHQLVEKVESNMDDYNIPDAMSPILPFLDDASNWYVRRSRRRFWKSEDDGDKEMAYRTLHYVLVRLAYVLAPFTPFLAEELYSKLTGDIESVHLKNWLPAGHVNVPVVDAMEFAKRVVNEGLSQRARLGIKVRQPLQSVSVTGAGDVFGTGETYIPIITDELNVKEINYTSAGEFSIKLDEKLTPALKREGLMREVVRHIQSARKQAGLNVDDRIRLSLTTEDDTLNKAIAEHSEVIHNETLASPAKDGDTLQHETKVMVDGIELTISLAKSSK